MAQGSGDFDALARRYWGMWGDAMRAVAPHADADAGLQGMREALSAWTRAAGGGAGGFDEVLAHFDRQNGDWLAQMQQLAAQFAGREHSARDVSQAWQAMLGGNAFHGLFQGMRGAGLQDIGQWSDAAGPWLQGLRNEAAGLLGMPAFGFAREHQQRLQALGQAQLRWQDALTAYNALMARVSQDAHARFEAKLAQREEPGRQLDSVRALFDLWVDAAEEAYADAALSPDYRQAYGELVNAQMRLRADAQAIAEQAAQALGLPGRTEIDSAHRKIAELERQLRRMQRRAGDGVAPTQANAPAPEPARPAARPAAKPKPARRAAKPASGPVARPAPAKRALKQAGKPATKTARKTAKTAKTATRRR